MLPKTKVSQSRSLIETGLSVSGTATPFGCCNFFDPCSDGIMSLHYSGQLPLLDWMGFSVSDVCLRTLEFLTWVRPARSGQNPTAGYICDPCDEPKGVEWGYAKLSYEDFARLGRRGPTREIMKPKRYCATRPLVRLDGSPVTDEREWDMRFVVDQILQDVSKMLVTGDHATCGQFDGLEHWVKTGYQSNMLDSIVIDWNGNPMSGGAGITWNGNPIAATFNFVDVLLAAYRRIKQRISWAPMLQNLPVQTGDMILVMPTQVAQCLLDFFTCWSVCDVSQYSPKVLQTYEARNFRNGLLGGLFGFGQITLDGQIIPILAYDYELIKGPKTADIYFLTGSLGAMRIWEGEHLSSGIAIQDLGQGGAMYWSTDNNRLLWTMDTENECRVVKGWMHPRLFCSAPFLNIRFQDVQCDQAGGFLSPDPDATSWFLETSFSQAVCP